MAASDRTARPKAAFVYMVRCTGGQLYTGWTNDPAARLRAHRSGRGARNTPAHRAEGYAYQERSAHPCAAPGSRPQKAAQGAKGAFVHGVAGRRTPLCGARRGQCRLNPVQNCKFWMQYCLLA